MLLLKDDIEMINFFKAYFYHSMLIHTHLFGSQCLLFVYISPADVELTFKG